MYINKKIAILRGINVGGKRKILMKDLKSLCEQIGMKEVVTYIQSGNIIFHSEESSADIENKLEKSIEKILGFQVPVIVRKSEEIQALVDNNPFWKAETEISQLHLTFLKSKAMSKDIEIINALNYEPDSYLIDESNVFIICKGKYHESKLTNNFFEKKLKVNATTRNWKTVLKLLELSRC